MAGGLSVRTVRQAAKVAAILILSIAAFRAVAMKATVGRPRLHVRQGGEAKLQPSSGISGNAPPDGPSPDHSPALSPASQPSRAAEWVQAVAAAAAVVLAATAGVVAFRQLLDQQNFNEQQLEFNQSVQDRQDKRYSSRVSFWIDDERIAELHWIIANRSPVPLRQVKAVATRQTGDKRQISYSIGDVPPCSVVTVTYGKAGSGKFQWVAAWNVYRWQFLFADILGQWIITEDGQLRRASPNERAELTRVDAGGLAEIPGKREEAHDCGEGG